MDYEDHLHRFETIHAIQHVVFWTLAVNKCITLLALMFGGLQAAKWPFFSQLFVQGALELLLYMGKKELKKINEFVPHIKVDWDDM